MLPKELLQKVHLIEISTRKVVTEMLSGQYRSQFKGQGVQFSEHRLYVPGDDVRHINWKVSARTREPLVKKYDEEREATVFLVVDFSKSKIFGSVKKTKSEIAAEIAGLLACAATQTGDKIGLLIFANQVEHILPPKKGRQHVMRVIRDLLNYEPLSQGTNLSGALDAAGRIMKHSGVVFVISDFIAKDYQIALKRLSRKHDVIAIAINDEREKIIPDIGQVFFLDPETGEERFVDTSSYAFKKWFKDYCSQFETEVQSQFKKSQVETLNVLTREDYAEAVVRFFRARGRHRR
jgi:uncharacterized protein (DUF58 family)